MLLGMVRNDLRRHVTVTITLVVLLMLSVMMATSSAGLLARLTGASGRLLEQADAPHVAQMHAGTIDMEQLDAWAAEHPSVAANETTLQLGIDNTRLSFGSVSQTGNVQQNSLVAANAERDFFLDLEGRPVTEVEPGTIWMPVMYLVEDDLQPGDVVSIAAEDGQTFDLRVAGFVRDAIMNTAIASSKRLVVAESDLTTIKDHTGTPEYLIAFWLHDPTNQIAGFKADYAAAGLPDAGPMVDSSIFRMFNMISEGMVAAVVILVSLLLMVVGLLCLRLSFLAAIESDRREIGVLTAIGVAPGGIKRIYYAKYGFIAGSACLLGLIGGWLLAPLMSRSLSVYLGSGSPLAEWLAPALVTVALFGIIWLFLWGLLRRVGRVSAVEALRPTAGTTDRGRTPLSLHRSRMPVAMTLGFIELLRRPGMYVLLLFVFLVSTFIVVVPASAATTITSPRFATYMGIGDADALLTLQHTDATSEATYPEVVEALEADPAIAEVQSTATTRGAIDLGNGEAASVFIANGDHTPLPITYADGRAPEAPDEIALSLLSMAESGARVGDRIALHHAGHPTELTVVGSYQDITNGGKTARARLPLQGADLMWYSFALRSAPGADVDATIAAHTTSFPTLRASKVKDFQQQQLGPIGAQITRAAVIAGIVAVALAALMTTMFIRMLLAAESAQIAIQRGIGSTDRTIVGQYLTRALTALVIGVGSGCLAGLTLGQCAFNLMFEGMFGGMATLFQGTSKIDFVVNPWLIGLLIPVTMLVTVGIATVASSRNIHHTSISNLVTE